MSAWALLWAYEAVNVRESEERAKDKIAGRQRAGEDRGLYGSVTKRGNRDHNDGAHWYVAEEGADWGWLPQYSHIRCDIAGTNAVNLNIVLTPFVA